MTENNQSHALLVGGFSPVHKGHELNFDQMKAAGHTSVNIFTTQSARRPISAEKKVEYIKKVAGPDVNVHTTVTPLHAASQMYSSGKRGKLVVYGGSDRSEIADRIRNYNNKESKHGFYNFDGVEFRQVGGERKEGAKGMAGFSGSAARKAKNPTQLKTFLPKALHADAEDIFRQINEEADMPLAIFLLGGPGSGKDYVLNNVFSRFDLTEVQADHLLSGAASELIHENKNIIVNGANDLDKIKIISALLEDYQVDHVFVSVTNKVSRLRNSLREQPLAESKRIEKFLHAERLTEELDCFVFNNSINLKESSELERLFFANQIEKLLERLVGHGLEIKEEAKLQSFVLIREKKFPAVRKKHGMPAKYSTGLSKSTALARKAHWRKMGKLSDRDPRAYEPAPGDATAETKPSKHTLAVRKMMANEGVISKAASMVVKQEVKNLPKTPEVARLTAQRQGQIEKTIDKTVKTASVPVGVAGLASDQAEANKNKKPDKKPAVDKTKMQESADKSLAAKAAKSGISLSTLRKVYRRGVAAWNSGHRPGTTPSQWGHARVNSYINKGKTYHTADKDLREDMIDERLRRYFTPMTPEEENEYNTLLDIELASGKSKEEAEDAIALRTGLGRFNLGGGGQIGVKWTDAHRDNAQRKANRGTSTIGTFVKPSVTKRVDDASGRTDTAKQRINIRDTSITRKNPKDPVTGRPQNVLAHEIQHGLASQWTSGRGYGRTQRSTGDDWKDYMTDPNERMGFVAGDMYGRSRSERKKTPWTRVARDVTDKMDAAANEPTSGKANAKDAVVPFALTEPKFDDFGNYKGVRSTIGSEKKKEEKPPAPAPDADAPAPAAPKYGEKGTGENKGKFWTGSSWKKPSEMSDEERYGKTGAAIRRSDPEAYKKRDKTAAGNLELLKKLNTQESASVESNLDQLFEMQLVGTDEYRIHAIAMTPGQNQEIEDVTKTMGMDVSAKEDCDCPDESDCGCDEPMPERNRRNFRELRNEAKQAAQVELPPTADVTPTLKKTKGSNRLVTPSRLINPAIDGLPVASRLTGESIVPNVAPTISGEIGRAGLKVGKKVLGKAIPIAGTVLAADDAISRAKARDYTGAAIATAAGIAYQVPVVGTAAGMALDATNVARDLTREKEASSKSKVIKPTSKPSLKEQTTPPPHDYGAERVVNRALTSPRGRAMDVAGKTIGAIKKSAQATADAAKAAGRTGAEAAKTAGRGTLAAGKGALSLGARLATGPLAIPSVYNLGKSFAGFIGTSKSTSPEEIMNRDYSSLPAVGGDPAAAAYGMGFEYGLHQTKSGQNVKRRLSKWGETEDMPDPLNWLIDKAIGEEVEVNQQMLDEAVQYHLQNKISFTENVFRPGSTMFFEMLKEAKRLYKEGAYEPKDEYEKDLLDSDVGEYAAYEGTMVPLDFPFEEESLQEEDETGGKGIGKPWRENGGGAVYVRDGGSIRKIRFSQSGMKKKYMDPAATKSFVARHRCLTNKDRTSASYWACRWPRFFSNSGKIWW